MPLRALCALSTARASAANKPARGAESEGADPTDCASPFAVGLRLVWCVRSSTSPCACCVTAVLPPPGAWVGPYTPLLRSFGCDARGRLSEAGLYSCQAVGAPRCGFAYGLMGARQKVPGAGGGGGGGGLREHGAARPVAVDSAEAACASAGERKLRCPACYLSPAPPRCECPGGGRTRSISRATPCSRRPPHPRCYGAYIGGRPSRVHVAGLDRRRTPKDPIQCTGPVFTHVTCRRLKKLSSSGRAEYIRCTRERAPSYVKTLLLRTPSVWAE